MLDRNKPKLLVVGTLHMETISNMITERQDEVIRLVQLLGEFQPTKIAVERDENEFAELKREYKQYLNNEYELCTNEIDQIGFRLAKNAGHQNLFPINWEGRITEEDLAGLLNAAEEHYPSLLNNLTDFQNKQLDLDENPNASIIDVYRQLNNLQLIEQLKQIYLSFSIIEHGDQKIGTTFLAKWSERELRILSNVLQLIDDQSDRILLLIGSDHLWMLRQLFEGSGQYEMEGCISYLG